MKLKLSTSQEINLSDKSSGECMQKRRENIKWGREGIQRSKRERSIQSGEM